MEAEFEDFYREIFADGKVDHSESEDLRGFIENANPPPNKLIWLRETCFRIGSEFLTGDHGHNVKILMAINALVHTLETTTMAPKPYVQKVRPSAKHSVATIGTDASIEKAVQQLWELDHNRLRPNRDYVVNVQKGKAPFETEKKKKDTKPDGVAAGEEPLLFSRVDERIMGRGTFKAFVDLLDNHSNDLSVAVDRAPKPTIRTGIHAEEGGVAAVAVAGEAIAGPLAQWPAENTHESWTFINAIMETPPMQFCHHYCCANNTKVPKDVIGFKKLLYKLWFEMYAGRPRNGKQDSCGFEQVFVGEAKDGAVSGFNNWIQFYYEEKKKSTSVNYEGYMKPRGKQAAADEDDHILTLRFEYAGVPDNVGTYFIGVSPEFEMALYTMCFLVGQEENKLQLHTGADTFELNIKCSRMAHDKVGTSFPECVDHHEE